MTTLKPHIGFGLGLRPTHYQEILTSLPKTIDWFEIITEDYLGDGGRHLYFLDGIRAHYPLVMHGVSMSIGGTDPLNWDYLRRVKTLIDRIEPQWISDHFCWTGVNQINAHDLLPLPFTDEALRHLTGRISAVQDFLGRRILLENVSSYVNYRQSEMTEWEFMTAVAQTADCLLLLDVNNIYVNAFNHKFDAMAFIQGIPVDRVQQFHIAGHTKFPNFIVDTHDHDVIQEVWDLYHLAVQRFGNVSLLVERDDNIPSLSAMLDELAHARSIAAKATANLAPQSVEKYEFIA